MPTAHLRGSLAARRIAEEMRRDPSVWAVGEDLGRGGVFGQYRGLVEEFGPERIADAPISEACIMGAAVGAAMMGTRPIVEMRFSDFALCAIDELVNQAAKARFMFGGQGRVPLVVREPIGMWRSSAAQHSQSLEGWYAHIPGLVVICAGDAGRQQGPAEIRDPLRRSGRLHGAQEPLAAGGRYAGPAISWSTFGKARMARDRASDLTIVCLVGDGASCLAAAEALASEGIEAEVFDLRSLWPWDKASRACQRRKTGRLHHRARGGRVGGFGAEIAATVAETLHKRLKAPVRRLGAPRVPSPTRRASRTRCALPRP